VLHKKRQDISSSSEPRRQTTDLDIEYIREKRITPSFTKSMRKRALTLNIFLTSVTDKAEEIQAPGALPTGKIQCTSIGCSSFGNNYRLDLWV
jgi:hypothetical protein